MYVCAGGGGSLKLVRVHTLGAEGVFFSGQTGLFPLFVAGFPTEFPEERNGRYVINRVYRARRQCKSGRDTTLFFTDSRTAPFRLDGPCRRNERRRQYGTAVGGIYRPNVRAVIRRTGAKDRPSRNGRYLGNLWRHGASSFPVETESRDSEWNARAVAVTSKSGFSKKKNDRQSSFSSR